MGFDGGEGGLDELVHALAADAGDAHDLAESALSRPGGLYRARQRPGLALDGLGVEGIDLVEADQLGLGREPRAIGLELGADGAIGLAQLLPRAVDQMDQHAAALDMAKEAVAQAGPLMGA